MFCAVSLENCACLTSVGVYHVRTPISTERGSTEDADSKPNHINIRMRNVDVQSTLGNKISEIEVKRKLLGSSKFRNLFCRSYNCHLLLDKQRKTSSLRRNVAYPFAMLLLIGLTVIAVLLVGQNILSMLIGIRALPISSKVSYIFLVKGVF